MNCNTEPGRAAFFRVVEHHPKLFQCLRKQVEKQCMMGQYGKEKIPEDQLSAQLINTFALGCLEVVGEDFDNLKKFITDEAALLAGNLRKPSFAPGTFLLGIVWDKIERPKDQIALQKKQESEGEAALDALIRSPQKEVLHKAVTEALLALNRCYKKTEEESQDFWRSSRQRISQGLITNALRDQEWSSFLQKVRNEHVAILSSFTTSLFSEKSTQAGVNAYIFLIRDHDGQVADLSPGSYNYMPSKMIHEGWTNSEEGTLLYVSFDGPFDINYTDGPPTSQQVQDMTNRPVFP